MTQLEFAFETKNHFALVIECTFLLKSRLSWRGIVLPVKKGKENERRGGEILFFVDFSFYFVAYVELADARLEKKTI